MPEKDQAWLLSEKYGGVKSEAFYADGQRLKNGEPLAYVIGHVPFLGARIHLDSRPLIPRPETEFWTEQAIQFIKSSFPDSPHILDLCAGSGAIGVAVARSIPQARVDLAEIDPAHGPTIKKNLEENTFIYESDRYRWFESDLFSNVPGRYDLILANPPYIDKEAKTVEASVCEHEPHLALFGGEGGLELITRIIEAAGDHLKQKGQLWIEHEPAQAAAIKRLAAANGLGAITHRDQYNVYRYSILTVAQ